MVFGRVTEGQGLLQKLNAVGTRSGKPKQRTVIVDCGELPSKRQIMLKLQVCLCMESPELACSFSLLSDARPTLPCGLRIAAP